MTLERLAIIIWIAFILTHLTFFKLFLENYDSGFNIKLTLKLILFFSVFGVLGTLFGIVIEISHETGADIDAYTNQVFTHRIYEKIRLWQAGGDFNVFWKSISFSEDEAIINFRVMILTVAGVIGGAVVGTVSGVLVGFQRYSLGGFSATENMWSSVTVGVCAGLIHYLLTPRKRHSPLVIMAICFVMELVRRFYLIEINPDIQQGKKLMEAITLPMLVGNTLGGYVFMKIIQVVNAERQFHEEKNKRKHEEYKSLLLYMVPHFIISSLTIIRSNITKSPDIATEQIITLSEYTSLSLESINQWNEGKEITIENEIDNITRYLSIMKGHYPKIVFSEDYDEHLLKYKCSLLVLQPLVENAINHGCKNKKEGNKILVSIADCGKQICLSVEDNGEGIPNDIKLLLGNKRILKNKLTEGTGAAFLNVIQRLKNKFNENFYYSINTSHQGGALIKIFIPKEDIDYVDNE
jgi:LytS/YehU family sensor histidine kinase